MTFRSSLFGVSMGHPAKLLFLCLGLAPFFAQAQQVPEVPTGVIKKAPTLSASEEALAQKIGTTLRCPVCQGMPIADSPAQMAQDMMRLVREKISEGAPREAIENYFVTRYGAWVLLRPPTSGIGLWVWVLPPAALALAMLALVRATTRTKGSSEPQNIASVATRDAKAPASARVRDWLREQGD